MHDPLLNQVRQRLHEDKSGESVPFPAALIEGQREAGRQLLALAVQYVARRHNGAAVLVQARESGFATGQRLAAAGCNAAQAVERFYFFVDRIEEVILGEVTIGALDHDQQQAQQRLKRFFREVLFGVMEGLDAGQTRQHDQNQA